MHKEIAEVVKVTEDKVFLKVEKKAMCSCCRIAPVCSKKQGIFEIAKSSLNLKEKDRVEVGVKSRNILQAIFIMFIFPLSLFVVSTVILQNRGELVSFFLALSVMVLYYVVVKAFLPKTKKFNIEVLRKIENGH